MPFLAFPAGGALDFGYCFQDFIDLRVGIIGSLFFKHSGDGFRLDMC